MMKKTVLSLLAVACSLLATAQTGMLSYDIAIARFQQLYNKMQTDSIFYMFSSKMQAALPLERSQQVFTGLHAQLGDLKNTSVDQHSGNGIAYKGSFANATVRIIIALNADSKIDGLLFQPYETTTAETPANAPKQLSNYNLQIGNNTTLYATLTAPETKKKVPVVLIIAGSGPTDRNGNSVAGVNCNTYLMLAEELKARGIACVRYDKRGIAESKTPGVSEASVRFDDMVDDAAGFVKKLKADGRFSKVYIAGHSEGSLIGMIVASKEKIDGFISLAGAGEPANKILDRQLSAQSEELSAKAHPILEKLSSGQTVQCDEPDLMNLFRPSVQPYLISWFKYDPATVIKSLKMPVLIIQGNTDLQVSVSDAALLHKALPAAQYKVLDQMTHTLKVGAADITANQVTYTDPGAPLHPELMLALANFIK